MPQVIFDYNIDKDIWNILRVINNSPTHALENYANYYGFLPQTLLTAIRDQKDRVPQEILVRDYLENQYKTKGDDIKKKIQLFTDEWLIVNDAYFKRLERMLDTTVLPNQIHTAYLTSVGSCPFNDEEFWCMVRMYDSSAINVVAHEYMHIYLRIQYSLYCRDVLNLSPAQFAVFQEASTVLLNVEMGDLLPRPDYGYKEHQEIRALLLKQWAINKNFKDLLSYYKTVICEEI